MTIPAIIQPIVRRAILDLLNDIGGQQNDDVVARLLVGLGHRVARRDVAAELRWLAGQGLIAIEEIAPFVVADILPDGVDVSAGNLRMDGIHRHRTGR